MRWVSFSLVTSLSFDIPRALLTAVLVALVAAPVLRVTRRATRQISVLAPERVTQVLGQKGLLASR